MAVRHPLYATPQKSYAMAACAAMRKKQRTRRYDISTRAAAGSELLSALIIFAQLKYRRGELDGARNLVVVTTRSPNRRRNPCGFALRI